MRFSCYWLRFSFSIFFRYFLSFFLFFLWYFFTLSSLSILRFSPLFFRLLLLMLYFLSSRFSSLRFQATDAAFAMPMMLSRHVCWFSSPLMIIAIMLEWWDTFLSSLHIIFFLFFQARVAAADITALFIFSFAFFDVISIFSFAAAYFSPFSFAFILSSFFIIYFRCWYAAARRWYFEITLTLIIWYYFFFFRFSLDFDYLRFHFHAYY